MEEFIRNKIITINSQRFLNEIKTFVWYHGKPQAMRGYNDDLVMALAIACWVRDTAIITNKRSEAYQRAMLNSMVYSRTVLNTQIKGQQGYNKKQSVYNENEDLEKFKNNVNEFSWIYKG